jgi:PIN domain nuclease of toxin-antitoxin system
MRLLLDTATLVYAVQFPERLSRRASAALHNLDNALELSAVSVTEIAIKSASGKLAFSLAALQWALQDLDIRILPYSGDHASACLIFRFITAIRLTARSSHSFSLNEYRSQLPTKSFGDMRA